MSSRKYTAIDFSRAAGFTNRESACITKMSQSNAKNTLKQWATFCVEKNIVDEQKVSKFLSSKKQSN